MANTYVDYTATAAQTDFEFTFPYLEDEHVKVEINGVATTAFTITTTPTQKVVLDSGATAGDQVRVRRRSAPNENLVDFVNGSVLTESELDLAYRHNRYLAEEIAELNDQSLQIEAGGTQWDAKGLRIKNVGDPTETTDATNKLYVDNKVNQGLYGSEAPLKWQFTGTAGTNTTYTVTGADINGDTVYDVSVDGLVQEPTVDYTVDPNTDTLTIKPTLSGGEDIVIIQRGFGVAVTGTVPSSSIVNGAVTTAKLDDGAVTTSKIDAGAVTTAKIDADAVNGSKIADDSIDSEHYVDGSIDSVHLAADVIDGTKIADDSIDSEHYVDGSIDTAHIADEAVTSSKISTADTNFNVQTSGRIGVGTNTPESLLHAQTGTESVRILQDNKSAITFESGALADIHLQHDGSSNKFHISHGSTVGSSKVITVDTNVNFVGINTSSPAAPLEIVSTIGGLIIPRMTTTQRNNIPGLGTDGEIIYNTSVNKFQGRAGGAWVDFH